MTDDIPEDVLATAWEVATAGVFDDETAEEGQGGIDPFVYRIARAIMAEREACVDVADFFADTILTADRATAQHIALAIRSRSG